MGVVNNSLAKMTSVAILFSEVVLLLRLVAIFMIRVRNNTDHEPLQPIREAFSFRFWDQRASVTIHLIDWIDFKTFSENARSKQSVGNSENFYRKCYCRSEYVFSPRLMPFLCALSHLLLGSVLPKAGQILVVNNHWACIETRSVIHLLSILELLQQIILAVIPTGDTIKHTCPKLDDNCASRLLKFNKENEYKQMSDQSCDFDVERGTVAHI